MLDKIKLALRISHTLLDSEINDVIAEARAEMIRSGILEDKANATDDNLINAAIKAYALYKLSNDEKARDGFFASWQYQLDNLRKSTDYMED